MNRSSRRDDLLRRMRRRKLFFSRPKYTNPLRGAFTWPPLVCGRLPALSDFFFIPFFCSSLSRLKRRQFLYFFSLLLWITNRPRNAFSFSIGFLSPISKSEWKASIFVKKKSERTCDVIVVSYPKRLFFRRIRYRKHLAMNATPKNHYRVTFSAMKAKEKKTDFFKSRCKI